MLILTKFYVGLSRTYILTTVHGQCTLKKDDSQY